MKSTIIKSFLICIFCLLLLSNAFSASAKDYLDDVDDYIPTNKQTFQLSDDTNLELELPGHWEVKKDSDGNIILNDHKAYGDLIVAIMNNVFNFKTDEELKKYVALHKQASLKTIAGNGKEQEGFDKVGEVLIPWIIIFEETPDLTMMHKISYLYNQDKVFVVMTTLSPQAPIKDAEKLLNSILISILKEGKDR